MRFLDSGVLLGLLTLGLLVDAKLAERENADVYTQWVTEYVTVNDCAPPSTTVTVCDICTPCVITA